LGSGARAALNEEWPVKLEPNMTRCVGGYSEDVGLLGLAFSPRDHRPNQVFAMPKACQRHAANVDEDKQQETLRSQAVRHFDLGHAEIGIRGHQPAGKRGCTHHPK